MFRKIFLVFLVSLVLSPISIKALEKEEMQQINLTKILEFEKPTGYMGFQGMTVTDKYIVAAAVTSDDSETSLFIFDKTTHEFIKSVVYTTLGHANDMSYNAKSNEILVINSNKVHVLDGESFEEKDSFTLNRAASALTYYNGRYYTLSGKTVYVYNEQLNQIQTFNTPTNLITQGIFYSGTHFYLSCYESGVVGPYEAVYDGILEAGANLIYVYDAEGNLVNALYIPTGAGEIEAIDFIDGEYFLLFNTPNGKGAFYTVVPEEIETQISVKFSMGDLTIWEQPLKASLYHDENVLETVESDDLSYDFKPISFSESGDYEYKIKQENDYYRVAYDEEDVDLLVSVSYDPVYNQLDSVTTYNNAKASFLNSAADISSYYCKIEGNTYYNQEATRVSYEEFVKDCGEIENPQTGDGFSWILFGTGILVALGLLSFRKTRFYKLG